jgi:hypothetical protein
MVMLIFLMVFMRDGVRQDVRFGRTAKLQVVEFLFQNSWTFSTKTQVQLDSRLSSIDCLPASCMKDGNKELTL